MRVLAASFVLSTALGGCANTKVTVAVGESPDQLVLRIAAQFSACDIEGLLVNYSTEVEFVSPGTPKPLLGLAAPRHRVRARDRAGAAQSEKPSP